MEKRPPRDFERLRALRAEAMFTTGFFELDHPVEVLWPTVSHSGALNVYMGSHSPSHEEIPLPEGGTALISTFTNQGFAQTFEEWPWEWVEHRWVGAERIFSRGPMKYAGFVFRLSPSEGGGTRVDVDMHAVKHGWTPRFLMKVFLRLGLKMFDDALSRVDAHPLSARALPFEGYLDDPSEHRADLERLARDWEPLLPGSEVPRRVAELVTGLQEVFVARLRPYEIAHYLGVPRRDALTFFLRATREGAFDMRWDVMCPDCRGPKDRVEHLREVRTEAHCDTCNIRFDVDYADHVELAFSPTPSVRRFEVIPYCAGGPGNTPHLAVQLSLDPRSERSEPVVLRPGRYRVRSPSLAGATFFKVEDGGRETHALDLGTDLENEPGLVLAPEFELTISNPEAHFQTVRIEHESLADLALTAREVAGVQEFRDLFGEEVLRPGLQLGVSHAVLMFTDLKDSTQIYETYGDSQAFAMVQEHFELMLEIIDEHEGCVVKTIGDAVMATFRTGADALRAGLVIQRRFRDHNERCTGPKSIVKMGLHQGPCILLNLNDRLDYFGGTVNLAARVQGTSVGDDITLSAVFAGDPEVRAILADEDLVGEPFTARLKGIEGEAPLVRLWPTGRPPDH